MQDVENNIIRLNKFISNCGICNRKEAVELVKKGQITLNQEIATNPFYELQPVDKVYYKGKLLAIEIKKEYFLMNKAKNVQIVIDSDSTKKSIYDLIQKQTQTRLICAIPTRNETSGLILLTNDDDVVNKYAVEDRPSKCVYEIGLTTEIREVDLEFFNEWANLQKLDFVSPLYGLEVKTLSDHKIYEIFEEKGYTLTKLDRTFVAGLTKKDLKRGWSRPLTEKEIIFIKHFH